MNFLSTCNQIHALSLPLLNKTISSVLKRCLPNADESLIAEVVNAVSESNVFSKCCDSGGCLSTIKRRNSYVLAEFPLVMPVEYMIGKKTCCICTNPTYATENVKQARHFGQSTFNTRI